MDCLFNKSFEKTMKGFHKLLLVTPLLITAQTSFADWIKDSVSKMNQKLFKFAIIFMSIQNLGTWSSTLQN